MLKKLFCLRLTASLLLLAVFYPQSSEAADKLVGLQSARVMSQAMPWIARWPIG